MDLGASAWNIIENPPEGMPQFRNFYAYCGEWHTLKSLVELLLTILDALGGRVLGELHGWIGPNQLDALFGGAIVLKSREFLRDGVKEVYDYFHTSSHFLFLKYIF
jgi:hypothetical protein